MSEVERLPFACPVSPFRVSSKCGFSFLSSGQVTDYYSMDPQPRSSRKRERRLSFTPPVSPFASADPQSRPSRASSDHHNQPSLPSIRHLHPYLPPSGMSQHLPGPSDSSSYSYPPPQGSYSTSASQFAQQESSALTLPGQMQPSDRPGRGDSDPDGDDQPGPPKKKRRRQALSCTGQ